MGLLGAAVRSASRRSSDAGFAKFLNTQTIQGLMIAVAVVVLFWIVGVYANGLRDANYFNGWMLAVGISLQIYFHIGIKTGSMAPKAAVRWRKIHIIVGYLLAAAFLSHTDFSLPETSFEWVLWIAFVFVTLSGIFGTYLAWSVKSKRRIDESIKYDRIPGRAAELAREVRDVVAEGDPNGGDLALPGLPHDAWIKDLYTNHLADFFDGQRNYAMHLIGSQRPIKRITDEIDNLSNFVDQQNQEKLAAIRSMVLEKDRLDFAHVYLGLTRSWLLIHVPFTYSMIVLMVLHILAAYSYSSGAW